MSYEVPMPCITESRPFIELIVDKDLSISVDYHPVVKLNASQCREWAETLTKAAEHLEFNGRD